MKKEIDHRLLSKKSAEFLSVSPSYQVCIEKGKYVLYACDYKSAEFETIELLNEEIESLADAYAE